MIRKVWHKDGELFHDACFGRGDSREGYDLMEDVDDFEECAACGGRLIENEED